MFNIHVFKCYPKTIYSAFLHNLSCISCDCDPFIWKPLVKYCFLDRRQQRQLLYVGQPLLGSKGHIKPWQVNRGFQWRSKPNVVSHQNSSAWSPPQVTIVVYRVKDPYGTLHFHSSKVSTGLQKVWEDPDSNNLWNIWWMLRDGRWERVKLLAWD